MDYIENDQKLKTIQHYLSTLVEKKKEKIHHL